MTTAPTEAEVRAGIRAQLDRYPNCHPLMEAVWDYASGPLIWRCSDPELGDRTNQGVVEPATVWMDLDGPTGKALDRTLDRACEQAAEAAEAAIIDVLVKAAVAFGRKHPDAGRVTPEARQRSAHIVARL